MSVMVPRLPAHIFLHAARYDPQRPSGSGRCCFRASSAGAFIQVSTSSGVVRITGIPFGWMAPTSALGSVVRKA
ncbi:hypothetical protein ACVWYH_003327 [Bradyrhizobium sp. GM24.11]